MTSHEPIPNTTDPGSPDDGRALPPAADPILVVAPLPAGRRRHRRTELATLERVAVDVATLLLATMITRAVLGVELSTAALLLFNAVAIALMVGWRAYAPKVRLDVLDDIRLASVSTAVAGMIVISAGALTSSTVDPNQILVLWLFSAALLAIGRIGATGVALHRRRTHKAGMNTLIVGAGTVGRLTAGRLLEHPEFGLRPVGFLDKEPIKVADTPLPLPVLGGSDDLEVTVAERDVDCVVIAFSNAPHDEFLHLLDECDRIGIRALVVPRLFERVPSRVSVEHVGGLPLLEMHATCPRNFQYALKYALDRLLGVLLLVVLSPVFIAIAVAVRVSLGRPTLYWQVRVGLDGRPFSLIKFRTMRTDQALADEALEFVADRAPGGVEGSDRRSRMGRLLRASSLDELPQLMNVVKGEMSLVGPRPERPEYVEYFAAHVHRYEDRHRVKGGITGWAQIHRLRGKSSIQDRVEWDNYYIENFSLWLDLKIMLLTIPAILRVRAE